jgi:hypothetical protein
MISKFTYVLILPLFILASANLSAQVEKVEVIQENGQWSLLVEGENYYVKGAGGVTDMDLIKASGGNTVRTWGVENAQEILDEAQEKGLKVMLGLWIQHERHGFDYNDADKIANQLENFRLAVRKYKDHPALLIWGIGNEYELQYSNTKVWPAVNEIAKMVHEEDKNHPTCTVTAGTNSEKLGFIMDVLTEVDIYGINTYGDIGSVKDVLKKGDFQGPYMITEWGPNGHWESPNTKWGSSIEQTSTEKADVYLSRYKSFIEGQPKQCIGSFAFLWGQKQEYTSTWYGLLTDQGVATEAVDVLQYCWSGVYPENRAPSIDSVLFEGSAIVNKVILNPSAKYNVQLFASDKNVDKLNIKWELYQESTDLKSGGDAEDKPPLIQGKIKGARKSEIYLKAPMIEGRYRLFVFVDDSEKMAYMNIPFYVQVDPNGSSEKIRLKSQTLKSFDEDNH